MARRNNEIRRHEFWSSVKTMSSDLQTVDDVVIVRSATLISNGEFEAEHMTIEVEDTYAEAFRSLFVEFLVTARDRK